jgi:glutamine amidotransferase
MAAAMDGIASRGLSNFIFDTFYEQKTALVGICLGMQIFFDHSEEGDVGGLGLLPGRVVEFKNSECHVGWNNVEWTEERTRNTFYFNHSYYVECDEEFVDAVAYSDQLVPAVVSNRNFVGVQFHPEKSQMAGLNLLKNLIVGKDA